MRSFKRIFSCFLFIILLICFVYVTLINPYMNSEYREYQDGKYRDELSGKIDLLVLGTSHSTDGLNPLVIDEKLNCFSYNLSNNMITWDSELYLLNKEISRNPVKRVIVDVSYNTLYRDEDKENAYGQHYALLRINNSKERLQYALQNVNYDDYLNLYTRQAIDSFDYWKSYVMGESLTADFSNKGFIALKSNSINAIKESNKSENNDVKIGDLSVNYRKENIEKFKQLIKICKDNGIEVVITVMPISEYAISMISDLDNFNIWIKQFAKDNDCPVYDLNLIKSRNDIINDEYSFFDLLHMSESGANTITREFCDIIIKSQTENVEDLFYDSYDEIR